MEPDNQFSYKPYELGLQNIVSPPTECVVEGVLKKFGSDDDSTIKDFTYLLQYTAKDALLDSVPTFIKHKVGNIIIRILNYTTDIFTSFNEERQLYINNDRFNYNFFFNNFDIILYKQKENPNLICLEIKDGSEFKTDQRQFVSNQHEIHFMHEFMNPSASPRFTQHHTKINNVQEVISKDPNLQLLIKKIPGEADLTKNPELLYFSARINSYFFTVLNYTNLDITFDLNRNLCINGKKLTNLTNDDCQIVAYHLQRHPEIICFEQKYIKKEELSPTFFAKMRWKHSQLALPVVDFEKKPDDFFSYIPYELGIQNIVSPPTYCINEGSLKRFDSNDERTITNFTYLLQYVAKDAILDKPPTFSKYNVSGTILKILNYTAEAITVSEQKDLIINDNNLGPFDDSNCDMIAYKVKDLPGITFFEQKNDDGKFQIDQRGLFMKPLGRNHYDFDGTNEDMKLKYLSQYSTRVYNSIDVISKDPHLQLLIQNVPEDADLTKNPKLLYFSARMDSCFFTVLNYTNHDITFDINQNLYINNKKFTHFTKDACQIVAYHLKNDPKTIYFKQKDVLKNELGPTIVASMTFKHSIEALPAEIFEDVRIHRKFKAFWDCAYDENSILSQVPKEIFGHIFSNYDKLMQLFTLEEQERIEQEKERQKKLEEMNVEKMEDEIEIDAFELGH